jgi:hypothetical protein
MAECLQHEADTTTPDVLFVRPKQARLLHRGPAKIVVTALAEIDVAVTQLAGCQSKAQFVATRGKVFPDFVNLSYIIANSFSITRDRAIRRAAVDQSIKTVERYFQVAGVNRFGAEIIREAIFCFDTLRRAYKLVDTIHEHNSALGEESRQEDRKLAGSFNGSALWAQLHLDCLRVVISKRMVQDQEVVDEILQGSRLSVMAYSYARQAVELRMRHESFLLDTTRNEEDEELLEESFSDYVEHESSIDAKSQH